MNKYKHLIWDSQFFGFQVALINEIETEQEYSEIINILKKKKYKLVYVKTNPKDEEINGFVRRYSGELIDQKITFCIDIRELNNDLLTNQIIEYQQKNPNNQMISLSLQTGEYSRFRLDKKFPENSFRRMYEIWISRSINKEIAEKVYVYIENEKIAGMVTLVKSNKIGVIGLIGVDSNYRERKIGKKLIEKTKQYCLKEGINKIHVATQLANKAACKFYKKCGFEIHTIENIYHVWL